MNSCMTPSCVGSARRRASCRGRFGAAVNAACGVRAKRTGLPLRRFLGRLTPAEIVDLIDFRYLSDGALGDDEIALRRDYRRSDDGQRRRDPGVEVVASEIGRAHV